jgi:hypothetical protein
LLAATSGGKFASNSAGSHCRLFLFSPIIHATFGSKRFTYHLNRNATLPDLREVVVHLHA